MDDPVRVTVETDDDERSVGWDDDEGAVSVEGATFRFDVTDLRRDGSDAAGEGVPPGRDDTDEVDEATPDDVRPDDVRPDGASSDEPTPGETSAAPVGGPRHLASLDDVPANTTLRFEAVAGRRDVEGIAQRQGDEVVAWENACPHEPDVRLDRGMGAFVADGQLICDNHGARFNCDDGFCTHGPCRGQSLRPIDVEVRGGEVFLTDDRFESCRRSGRTY